jgi:hypothetical protein
MMTPENFADAINRSMAEVRNAMQETAERLEAEFRRFAAAAGLDERVAAERMKASNEQLREMVDSLRVEASRAAGEVSEGMNEMMAEFRRLLEATMPGWGDGTSPAPADSAGTAATAPSAAPSPSADETPAAKKAAKKSTKKATAKKAATKKAAKKPTKKATAKKSAKKAATKKAAKKPTKKATAKKPTKKATAKKSTKKATAKKSTKKAR